MPATPFTTTNPLLLSSGTSNCLGLLPTPASLVSLPISTGTSPTWVTNTPSSSSTLLPTTLQSILPHLSSNLYPDQSILTLVPSLSNPGMILSPAADPIPHSLVQRIQSGQFVDMRDLLADNVHLLNQLSSLHGATALPLATINRTRLREIPSLTSWLYCFNAYVAVRTPDPLTRQMLAYSRLIIRESLRHGGAGWLEYDRVFRRQLSIDPTLRWNTLEPGLQAATILGQRTSAGILCSLCRESDHSTSQCALAPLQQQLINHPQVPPAPRSWRRPETLQRICVSWNKGQCNRPRCSYRHVCATCQRNHKARDCAETPPDSEYKSASVQPPRTSTATP